MVSVFHALDSSPVAFVPAIHESAAVAAADGYARVRGSACVLLYMIQGVANSMANLYNAWCDETPLLVLASQPESSAQTGLGAMIGEGDVIGLASHYTRFGHAVPRGSSLRGWLERADRIATGPPGGPVLLAVPEDVLTGPSMPPIDARSPRRVAPGAPALAEVRHALASAERPLLVVGGQVQRYGGASALMELAERLRIPVLLEQGFLDRMPIPPDHPNCLGWMATSLGRTLEQEADVVLAVGCRLVLEAHAPRTERFPTATFIAHVNADPAKLEGLTNAHWSCACSPAAFLEELLATTTRSPDPARLARRGVRLAAARARAAAVPEDSFTAALHDALDRGWVVDESVSLYGSVLRSLRGGDGARYLSMSGASLGWATGAACGVALASGEPVTCVLGDGALRFGAQALWTAKACDLPVSYVVLDNGGFGSTRSFERQYVATLGRSDVRAGYVGSDLRDLGPPVPELIAGYGIPCETVAADGDVRSALLALWGAKGPNALVIDVGFDAGAWAQRVKGREATDAGQP